MDRLATSHMTSKGRGSSRADYITSTVPHTPITPSIPLDQNSYFEHNYNRGLASFDNRWSSEATSKAKTNQGMENYHLERQSKNQKNYETFVSSLNRNIFEDQERTGINNNQWQMDHGSRETTNNFDRIYHPTLNYAQVPVPDSDSLERSSQTTRDRREHTDGKAINPNTVHMTEDYGISIDHTIRGDPINGSPAQGGIALPPPKLNYPFRDNNPSEPLAMDPTSHIGTQFQTLTNIDMERQIQSLQNNIPTSHNFGQTPMDRQTYFHTESSRPYNPHADYLNNQLHQMSQNYSNQGEKNSQKLSKPLSQPMVYPEKFQISDEIRSSNSNRINPN